MKNILLLFCLFVSLLAGAQTYSPNLHVPVSKSIGISIGAPVDARTYFYDATLFKYRQYTSVNEVYSYLNLSKYREGGFPIVVNTGGNLSGGVITGGVNNIYWFRNGTTNADLVLMNDVQSVNGRTGIVVTKNADSVKTIPVDVSANRHHYVFTYDSTLNKFYLAAASGTTYTAGTGIDVTNGVIRALNTTAMWNANQLRGRNISTNTPNVNQIYKWNGLEFAPANDNSAFDSAYFDDDTLYVLTATDTIKVFMNLQPVGDNWGTQSVATDSTFIGVGLLTDKLKLDTVIWYATKTDIANLQLQIDTMSVVPGTSVFVHNASGAGDTLVTMDADTVNIKRIEAGANIVITPGANKITISSTPGSAEVNDIAVTLASDDDETVPVESMVDYILVKPTANLTAFKLGTALDDDAFITSTPVQANGEFQVLIAPFYLSSSTAIYFSGITSSTDIQIIYKPLHN